MATTTEQLILAVDIPVNLVEIAKLKQILADNKTAAEALNKAFKDGRLSSDELAAGQARLGQESRNAQQSIGVLQKAVDAQRVINNAAAGSVDELAAKSKLLTAQYNALGAAEKNTADGQALQANLKKTNEALKAAGAGVGDFRRAVGDYNAGVKDVNVTNGKAIGFFEKLGTTAGGLPGPLRNTAAGLAETGKGLLTATKAALAFIATPLGAFLAVITAAFFLLKEAFTATDDGQEALAGGLAGLKAALSVLEGVAISAGKGLALLFTEPKQAAGELIEFLETNFANRIKAYGVLFDALRNGDFKQATNGALQLATGVENVVDKTKALAGEMNRARLAAQGISAAKDELENLEIKAIANNEIQRQQAERLVLTAKDRNLTEAQRIKNLNEADRLEKEVLGRNLEIEGKRLSIIRDENKERAKTGKLLDDERRAEQEQVAKLTQLQGQADAAAQSRENRRSALQQQEAASRAAAAAAAAKVAQDAIKEEITATQTRLLSVRAGSEEELALKEQLVRQKVALEAAGEKKTAADRRLAVATSLLEISKLEDEFRQKRLENAAKELEGDIQRGITANAAAKKRLDDAAKDTADNYKADEAMLERYLARRSTAIEQDYAEGKLDKKQYDKAIELLDQTSYGARIVLAKHYNKDTSALEEAQAKAHRKGLVKTREEEEQTYKDRAQLAAEFGAEVGRLFVDTLNQTGGSLQEFAGKVLILILDSLEKVVLAQQAEAIIKGIAKGPAGLIEAGIEAALITVAFEGAKAAIGSTSAKPFNTGGIVGGDVNGPNVDSPVPVLLSAGEVVITRAAAQANLGLLSQINAQYGGANFAPGFTPRPYQTPDGGFMARTLGGGPAIDYERLAQACAKIPVFVNPTHVVASAAQRAARVERTTLR